MHRGFDFLFVRRRRWVRTCVKTVRAFNLCHHRYVLWVDSLFTKISIQESSRVRLQDALRERQEPHKSLLHSSMNFISNTVGSLTDGVKSLVGLGLARLECKETAAVNTEDEDGFTVSLSKLAAESKCWQRPPLPPSLPTPSFYQPLVFSFSSRSCSPHVTSPKPLFTCS